MTLDEIENAVRGFVPSQSGDFETDNSGRSVSGRFAPRHSNIISRDGFYMTYQCKSITGGVQVTCIGKERMELLGGQCEHFVVERMYPAYRKYVYEIADTEAYQNQTEDDPTFGLIDSPRAFAKRFLRTPEAFPFTDFDMWTRERMGDYLNHLAYINMMPAENDNYDDGY
jgi:hypothetical protein